MNLTQKITLTLGLLASAGVGFAQETASTGLLGQRYGEVSVGQFNPHGIDDNGFVGDASVNLPITAGIDVGFSYNYSRANLGLGGPVEFRTRNHTVGTSSTFYSSFGNLRPFAGAAVGYQWSRDRLSVGDRGRGFRSEDDEAVWGLGAGVEIPFGTVTVTPTVTYQDGFHSDSAAGFTYGAEAHMWFTNSVGGFVDATYSDPTGGGNQGWIFKIGARVRF